MLSGAATRSAFEWQPTIGAGHSLLYLTLVYSTYLGGSGQDRGIGIALDTSGNAYVAGLTASSNFPTTAGAFQATNRGGSTLLDVFVTKVNPAGTGLVYSTYLGGSSDDSTGPGNTIAVDASGNAYVTGRDNRHFPRPLGPSRRRTMVTPMSS